MQSQAKNSSTNYSFRPSRDTSYSLRRIITRSPINTSFVSRNETFRTVAFANHARNVNRVRQPSKKIGSDLIFYSLPARQEFLFRHGCLRFLIFFFFIRFIPFYRCVLQDAIKKRVTAYVKYDIDQMATSTSFTNVCQFKCHFS